MKISQLELFKVPPRWLFLKMTTSDGLVGWGEPVVEGKADTVAAAVHELSGYVEGRNPDQIEDIWQVLYRGAFYRGGPVLMSAMAGIDQALWDIKGKRYGLPAHQLLGGRVRERIQVYSWIGGDRPGEVIRAAQERTSQGYRAIKMNASAELHYIDTPARVDEIVERVGSVRQAVGKDFGIAVDFHGRVHRPMAKVLAKALEQFQLMFIEEPVLSEYPEAIIEVARHTSTPIALGERLFSRWDFKGFSSLVSSISCSRTFRMPAASVRLTGSAPWRKHMISRSLFTALSDRSRSRLAFNWMRAFRMPLFRSRASGFTTTKAANSRTT
jgi:galactonate dehydratase